MDHSARRRIIVVAGIAMFAQALAACRGSARRAPGQPELVPAGADATTNDDGPGPQAGSEVETESGAESEAEAEAEAAGEAEAEVEGEAGAEVEGEPAGEAEPEAEAAPDSEPEAGTATNAGADSGADGPPPDAAASVLQHHKNPSRDGLYVDDAFSAAAFSTLHLDTGFAGPVTGAILAQPLYVEAGPHGQEAFLVATEANHVVALDSAGRPIWDRTYGTPVTGNLPCGNINPLGITGTPIVDLADRTLYFDAMTTPDGYSATMRHLVYAVSLDDGSVRPGWPADITVLVPGFDARLQNQRGALQLAGGTLYVPFGGHSGDCDPPYHGWVIGLPVEAPTQATYWRTAAPKGGIWTPGGLSTDGRSVFVATGNTVDAGVWAGGEAVLRLGPGTTFSGQPADYFYPANWQDLDTLDFDLGGSNPVLFDMPSAPVPHLLAVFAKDGNLYLLNRDDLGGPGGALSATHLVDGKMNAAPAVFTTPRGTFVAFHVRNGSSPHGCPADDAGNVAAGNLGVAQILPGSPPSATLVWCAPQQQLGAPIVTTPDGVSGFVVWTANDRLYAFDGETGAALFDGGGASDGLAEPMHYFNTPIAAKGRIVLAGGEQLYVFRP
jgi:hypothetical protein